MVYGVLQKWLIFTLPPIGRKMKMQHNYFRRNIYMLMLIASTSVIALTQHTYADEQEGHSKPNDKSNSNFSVLNLEIGALLGSRWAIEQKSAISVTHAVEVTDAVLIDKNQLSLRIEFYIRQKWIAEGLEFPEGLFRKDDRDDVYVSAGKDVLKHMWSPDSYISTARESNMAVVDAPNSVVHIFSNRTIIFKARLFTNVACSTNFVWYPIDQQSCYLVIESYKYTDKYVKYVWENNSLYRPLTLNIERLLQYDLVSNKTKTGARSRGGRGVRYPFVAIKFVFARKLGNTIIQVYTPTTLVVVLSWFSFWLGLDAIPGRVTLLVTCMLTLVTMHSGMKGMVPPVHYVHMLDVWMIVCMAFVFMSICEFVVLKYSHWKHQLKKKSIKKMEDGEDQLKLSQWFKLLQASIASGNPTNGKETHMLRDNGISVPGDLPSNPRSIINPHDAVAKLLVQAFMAESEASIGDHCTMKLRTGYNTENQGNDAILPPCKLEDPEVQILDPPKAERKPWVAIDKFCRLFFPCLFVAFNSIYWPVLLQGGCQQKTDKIFSSS